jgi:hypothetical protein
LGSVSVALVRLPASCVSRSQTDLEYATFQFAFLLFSGTSLSVFWSWLVTPLVMTRSRG